jgi:hypothetical protein
MASSMGVMARRAPCLIDLPRLQSDIETVAAKASKGNA